MKKPHRIADERIAEEIRALDEYLAQQPFNRQLACFANGARIALDWVRDSRQADPLNPMRMLSLLEFALPRVIDFDRRSDQGVNRDDDH